MLNHFLTDVEVTLGSGDVVLQKDNENNIGRKYELQGRFKVNKCKGHS